MNQFEALKTIPKYIIDCPVFAHWVTYRNEVYFATLNYEKSVEKGKAYLDLAYCATASFNGQTLRTVKYDKSIKFKKFKF
jgi:hypothetical protein